MLINKNYCDENTCVALRELGYNYPQRLIPDYFGVFEEPQYDEKIHLYDAQQWLREEKDMNVYVKAFNGEGWYYVIQNYKGARIYPPLTRILVLCHSYEEALSEGIKKAVKILKGE